MSIQYMAPGFKPTTSQTRVSCHNHLAMAPVQLELLYSRK